MSEVRDIRIPQELYTKHGGRANIVYFLEHGKEEVKELEQKLSSAIEVHKNDVAKMNELEHIEKKLREAFAEVKSELEWAQMTVRDKLKFGLPEEEAIKRRESRCRGVFLTALKTIDETLNELYPEKGEK